MAVIWGTRAVDLLLDRDNPNAPLGPWSTYHFTWPSLARPAFENQPGARPATNADILPNQGDFGLQVRVGDMIAPAELYAGDHDMFVFLVNENRRIDEGTGAGMARGFFVMHSEVGGTAFFAVTEPNRPR